MEIHFFSLASLQFFYKPIMYGLCALMIFGSTMAFGQEALKISGVYRLTPAGDKARASAFDGADGFKVYTENYYISASINSIDSVKTFEIGTYTMEGNKLKEHIISGSLGPLRIGPTDLVSEVHKNMQELQIIWSTDTPGMNVRSTIENYKLLEKGAGSVLDGAWEQLDSYAVAGKDTTWNRSAYNFKIIYNGYYIWGAHHKMPHNQHHDTYWGIGAFEMQGDSIQDERNIMATLPWVKEGREHRVFIEFINDDTFKQTIYDEHNKTGYVEIYQRLESNNL